MLESSFSTQSMNCRNCKLVIDFVATITTNNFELNKQWETNGENSINCAYYTDNDNYIL